MENKIITKKQKNGIKIIQQLLNEMHKDIKELMELKELKLVLKKLKMNQLELQIAIALQEFDIKNGGEVAKNLEHLYKHGICCG